MATHSVREQESVEDAVTITLRIYLMPNELAALADDHYTTRAAIVGVLMRMVCVGLEERQWVHRRETP